MNKRYKSSVSKKEIREAYELQQKNSDWNLYSEREFVENLLSNRFNFLLVTYSFFVMAFVSIDGKINKLVILTLGLIIVTLVSMTIYRAYRKLMINLKYLHDLKEYHVFPLIRKEVESRRDNIGNVNPIIGIIIPSIFVVSFVIAIIFISTDIWVFNK
ncbi:MAG: hypothetical protein LBM67_06470 [Lentimicrobiaceae bacterium]|nr:hypothetical protein [Lentimicrobiaceae bacterium]